MSWPDLLPQVKAELSMSSTKTDDDAALRRKIDAACDEIERRVGRVATASFTETHDVGYDGMVVLDERPVLDVTNVSLLSDAGAVLRDYGVGQNEAPGGVLYGLPNGRVRISYKAGRDPIPGDFLDAAVQLSAHLWRQARSLDGQGRVRSDAAVGPGMSSAMPNKVKDLLGLTGKSSRSRVFVG